jgi:hypothetical protein
MEIYVSPMKAKRMMNAVKKGKGMKLTMTPDEMDHTMKHGKGVMLPSRKIFIPAKEGMPTLAKKGVITHNAPVAAVNAGNDTFQVVRGDPVAPSAPAPKRRGGRKKKVDVEEGGKISLKDVGRALKKGAETVGKVYRENVRNTAVGDAIRKGAKSAIVTGITALPTALGNPEFTPMAGMVAKPLADSIVKKAGLGARGFVLNSNYNNFLNPLHPAMSPTLPPADNSVTRGGSFVSAGYRMRGAGLSSISNLQPLGSAMNPTLPPADNSMTRGRGFMSAGY